MPELVPLTMSSVAASFPSPADDFIETQLNLHQYVVKHPAATFFVRVSGDSMSGIGMYPGDILVVDRSLRPKDGDIIIAALNGDFTVKRLVKQDRKIVLMPENRHYRPIPIAQWDELIVWGIVTHCIHHVQ